MKTFKQILSKVPKQVWHVVILLIIAIVILVVLFCVYPLIISSKISINDKHKETQVITHKEQPANIEKQTPVNISEKTLNNSKKLNTKDNSLLLKKTKQNNITPTGNKNSADVANVASEKEQQHQNNAVNFDTYIIDIQNKIKANWKPPISKNSRKTVVLFTVAKDGSIVKSDIVKSSGNKEMDKSSLTAINVSAPFNRLPEEYTGDEVDIQFTFDYNFIKSDTKTKHQKSTFMPLQSDVTDDNEQEQVILSVPIQ